MSILIIGASGFIGRYVSRRLANAAGHTVVSTYNARPPGDDGASWHRLEMTDPAALDALFGVAQPDAVVHLAAMADVGTAERNPEVARAVNATATETIARLCRRHGARLVFVSTEYVFDGQNGPYREDDPPAPTTQYGRTKFQAEQAVASLASNWSVLRTSIVYGWPAPGRRNFVPMLVNRLRNGEAYRAPTNVYRSPVYVEHLVDGIKRLVETEDTGVHHVAGRDWATMYEFAVTVAEEFGLDPSLVIPVTDPMDDRLGLDCTRTMARLGLPHPGLNEGLAVMRAAAPIG
ncbi:MAG: SDR family oxidoreductase [Chloroflexota bacterium]|nr:SDR family oxidoreductase [Chloroflexota bacterium]MDE2959154.1 SDR family oxidoreductase [Chloroflexota bacterium]